MNLSKNIKREAKIGIRAFFNYLISLSPTHHYCRLLLMYSPTNHYTYQAMNYYTPEPDTRRMSFCDYLSSSSSSSSYSDYESSPLTGAEEYFAGQPKFYYQQQYPFVQQLQEPGANTMIGYYDCLIDTLMPSAPPAPMIAVESKQRIHHPRAKRSVNSSKKQDEKTFLCRHDDCGKVFKRSEHLKRHMRSIHTREKRE